MKLPLTATWLTIDRRVRPEPARSSGMSSPLDVPPIFPRTTPLTAITGQPAWEDGLPRIGRWSFRYLVKVSEENLARCPISTLPASSGDIPGR
jgi:hypothetical protein